MHSLTTRQARVLAFIKGFISKNGFPPTHAEIAKGLRFRSPNAAAAHLRLMAKKGVVTLVPGASRGVRIEDDAEGEAGRGLPLVGQVAAGQPILAEQNVERHVDVDPALFRPRAHFMLRVRGDSMIDAGILPGDLVAVNKTATVRDGEIAVVRIDEDVTVKRWRLEKGGGGPRIVLEPANDAHRPIVIDPRRDTFAVEGRVVGVLRLAGGG